MNIKDFKRPNSQDPDINNLSLNVSDFTRQLTPVPFLSGRLIEQVKILTTVQIPHGLGKDWTGYFVLNSNSPGVVYTTNTANKNLTLNLTSTSAVIVDLWVF